MMNYDWHKAKPVSEDISVLTLLLSLGLKTREIGLLIDYDLLRVIHTPKPLLVFCLYDHKGCKKTYTLPLDSQYSSNDQITRVLADPFGQQLISCNFSEWVPQTGSVVITEGLYDWLIYSTKWSDADEEAPAVLGIVGNWNMEMASRIPDGWNVILTDPSLAEPIQKTLQGRCSVVLFAEEEKQKTAA